MVVSEVLNGSHSLARRALGSQVSLSTSSCGIYMSPLYLQFQARVLHVPLKTPRDMLLYFNLRNQATHYMPLGARASFGKGHTLTLRPISSFHRHCIWLTGNLLLESTM